MRVWNAWMEDALDAMVNRLNELEEYGWTIFSISESREGWTVVASREEEEE